MSSSGATFLPATLESEASGFAARLQPLQERIAKAAAQSGRSIQEITLVAVTKKQSITSLLTAVDSGIGDLGENYVQEALEKRDALNRSACRWHLIGHLQSNKARTAVETFDLIQSVDSVRLAYQIGKFATALGKVQQILLQAHLGDEETKSGLPPGAVAEAAREVQDIPGLSLKGLMGIAPQGEEARPHFQTLRRVFETLPSAARIVLSMGMSNDFEAAIEEGATMVRIGTALFGTRMTSEVPPSPVG